MRAWWSAGPPPQTPQRVSLVFFHDTAHSAGCVFGAFSLSKRAAMTALEKKPVTVKDVGLVQGLLVVAAKLKKYGRDGLDTNSACADPPSLQS